MAGDFSGHPALGPKWALRRIDFPAFYRSRLRFIFSDWFPASDHAPNVASRP